MSRVKVRGIYATALTRLLLDNGFKIVQPSAPIRERFKLPNIMEEGSQPDIEINDRLDKQGINVVGDASSVEKFISILFENLEDVVVRRYPSIYTLTQLVPCEERAQSSIMEIVSETLKEAETSTLQRRLRVDVEFPSLSKRKLDEIRSTVVPTLNGHHYYKACGGKIAYMLEMAEKLLEKGCPVKEVEELFSELIEREYPHKGSKISIEHVKVDGKVFHLGEAHIIELDEQNMRIKILRVFSTSGIYDGLKIPKEPGDYAVTSMSIGEWSYKTSYFSKNGEYKGTYVNINTPIEVYPSKIRYVDLEADICMWPDGRIQKIDFEKLDEIAEKGYISERLRKTVHKKIGEILNNLSPDIEKETRYVEIWNNEKRIT
jgi:protein associated with RNAse G/E